MMNKLFVYGSLMNAEVLDSLLRKRSYINRSQINPVKIKAILYGYLRVAVMDAEYPAIYPESNASVKARVEGELIVGLSQKQIEIIDEFEGDQYQRYEVTVTTEDQVEHRCFTYVFKTEYYSILSNKPWSYQAFCENHLESFLKRCFIE